MKPARAIAASLSDLASKGVNMDFINAALAASKSTTLSEQPDAPKPSKHHNQKVELDGHTFDSKKEANHYLDLREQQRAGQISELRCQVPFPIVVNGIHICDYKADFVYVRNGVRVIEDVKSKHTRKLADYRLKNKLMAALGTPITEVV